MLVIKTPEIYINEPHIIKKAGVHVAKYGRKPLIVGSPRALEAVGDDFFQSLENEGIETSRRYVFSGFPSESNFKKYEEAIKETGADSIIGLGGGKVLDTVKRVGNNRRVPVITVPTVAATCAAWAAVTIQYDDEGGFVNMAMNDKCPRLILADPAIILKAPVRYLYSGIIDTFAKYYETRPLLEQNPTAITLDFTLHAAFHSLELLRDETEQALEEASRDEYGVAAKHVVDAIIYIAGMTGSFQEFYGHYSYAHPFYHCSTRLAHTRKRLHGEKVGFGILVQLFLEHKSEPEILETLELFDRFHSAFILEDFGIVDHVEEDLEFLKKDITETFPFAAFEDEDVVSLTIEANDFIKKHRKNVVEATD